MGNALRQRGADERPILVIMAKAPVAGAVKSRLARDIGATAATSFYRAVSSRLVERLSRDARWQTVLAIQPHAAFMGVWRGNFLMVRQKGGDLGARMQHLFDRLGRGPLIIIGSDIPGIKPEHIAQAFRLLRGADAVIGPAQDGGYWLIGFSRRPRILRIFKDVRWSSPHTLADTLANLGNAGVAFAATLPDVDDGEDFARWRRSCAQR